jgi:hypothetical protein
MLCMQIMYSSSLLELAASCCGKFDEYENCAPDRQNYRTFRTY